MSGLDRVEPRTERRALRADRDEQTRDTYGPWLTAASAAQFLDFGGKEPVEAFRAWAKRHGLVSAHRGSRLLYARVDLERAIGVDVQHGGRKPAAVPSPNKFNSVGRE